MGVGVKHSRDPLLGMALPLSTARGQRETHVVPLLFPVQPTHKIFEGTSKTSRKMELKDISVLAKIFFLNLCIRVIFKKLSKICIIQSYVWGQAVWCGGLGCHLQYWLSTPAVLRESWLHYFQHTRESSRRWLCTRGPCHPHRRPRRSSCLLPSVWSSPDLCSHLGSESVYRRPLSFPLSSSLSL